MNTLNCHNATPMSAWTRRHWLGCAASTTLAVGTGHMSTGLPRALSNHLANIVRRDRPSALMLPEIVDDGAALVQRGVDAAVQAGAQYADARLTRMVWQRHGFSETMIDDREAIGVGVRALVNGYWGFAACPSADSNAMAGLARSAVAQAKVNAQGGSPRSVELGTIPAAVGHWATPVKIDPFQVPLEEKAAFMRYWDECSDNVRKQFHYRSATINKIYSFIKFAREERIVATSQGNHFSQTVFESGGHIVSNIPDPKKSLVEQIQDVLTGSGPQLSIHGIEVAGRGWELFLDAKIPEQIQTWPDQAAARLAIPSRPAQVGKYTVVCDGGTMAALLAATLGVATQLDRALGYEANAGGTSFLDDPLAMLGTFKVGSPMVNVTANRSAPAQLATVKWDLEGVVPEEFPLVKNGILVDFQTTREQAEWLASYYTKIGRPLQSHGCAGAESALAVPMQHMPNLSLEPSSAAVSMDDLIGNVKDGLFIEEGEVYQIDAQARNGLLFSGKLRQIKNGRLGAILTDGALAFNTLELWRNVIAVGGPATRGVASFSQYPWASQDWWVKANPVKGEPPQATSHSVQAAAATILNQPLINPLRNA